MMRVSSTILAAVLVWVIGSSSACTPPPKQYHRSTTRIVDTYHSTLPARAYQEIQRVSATFREFGFFTGSGSDEMLVEMLKDKAAGIGADAIIEITVESHPEGGGSMNLIWRASAIAIKYTGSRD